jgi:hypothetical protein
MPENTREGFRSTTINADVRKNGKYIQLIVKDKEGKDRFYIMYEVPSLRGLSSDKTVPFLEG